MIAKYAWVAVVLGVAAFALWHPSRGPVLESATAPVAGGTAAPDPGTGRRHRFGVRQAARNEELIVYVAGAVKKTGLFHLRFGDRYAQAVALAGGPNASAQPGGVNLAQHANDGDEIYVPAAGEALHKRPIARRGRRHSALAPPTESLDVNRADATELAAVPGIGRAIAVRIVELREREGSFASLDELLDVSGMTATRLERARPYLREP
jgi:competence protein ComEA